MKPWKLPTSLEIGGVGYPIRSDYRDILKILDVLGDPGYEEDEKSMIFLIIFFPTYKEIPRDKYQEAMNKAVEFIDMGMKGDGDKKRPATMHWGKDATIIIPAVNRVLGTEVRSLEYMHWWTFLGAYLEIGESLFSSVLGIRQKKAKGKKLEKYEQEFYRENKQLVDLEPEVKRSEEEIAELHRLFGMTK